DPGHRPPAGRRAVRLASDPRREGLARCPGPVRLRSQPGRESGGPGDGGVAADRTATDRARTRPPRLKRPCYFVGRSYRAVTDARETPITRVTPSRSVSLSDPNVVPTDGADPTKYTFVRRLNVRPPLSVTRFSTISVFGGRASAPGPGGSSAG